MNVRPIDLSQRDSFSVELDSLLRTDSNPLLWTPRLLDKPSGWWGHVPFAFWIVSVCKPHVLVELGTHNGASYAAFCEAIRRLRLQTRSYAVDSWMGDPQAGHYGDDVFAELKSFHDLKYSAFSELLRMQFDEGSHRFSDNTIDVLHIDGYHTYEAVSHDFNTWLPKLSRRGVVLFHDTNVRRDDFGVWRFFEELSRTTPCFEFLHCHGLGVAALGPEAPEVVKELCRLDEDAAIAGVRETFSRLGAVWMSANNAILEGRRLLERIAVQDDDIARAEAMLGERAARIVEKDGLIAAQNREIARTKAVLGEREEELAKENAELARTEATLAEQSSRLALIASERDAFRAALASVENAELARTEASIAEQSSRLALAESERDAARAALASVETEAAVRTSRLSADRDFLARYLSRTFHRPWRPFKFYIVYNLLRSLGALSAPFSERMSSRFRRSAQKRSPSRFDVYLADAGVQPRIPVPAAPSLDGVAEAKPGRDEHRRIGDTKARGNDELSIPELNDKAVEALNQLRSWTSNAKLEDIVSLGQMSDGPSSVCFVLPIVSGDSAALDRSIQSVLRQTDPTWELLLISEKSHAELARDWLDVNWRIRYTESDVSDLPSIAKFATNGFLVNLRQGDAIDDDYIVSFLRQIKEMGSRSAEIDLVYVDEFLCDENNNIIGPFYKPDWSPEHLESVNYIGRGFAVRKSLLLSMSRPLPNGLDAGDYALLLDVATRARTVLHIDEALYLSSGQHNRDASGCFSAESLPEAKASLERKVHAENPQAEVRSNEATGALDVVWPVPSGPITLVILTGLARHDRVDGGKTPLVTNFVRSIIKNSTCENYKILVIDDGQAPEDLIGLLAEHGHEIHSFKRDGAFSFAEKANFGVSLAPDGVVILLNDDMEVISSDWIERMAGLAARAHIGAVGALLLYPEGTIQHAGLVVGYHGGAGHVFHRSEPNGSEYGRFATVQRNYAAVTAAAIAFRKSVFVSLGGFDKRFVTDYNDVDLCLRCIEGGYRIVQLPAARLYHFDNSSYKRPCDDPRERTLFVERWLPWIERDPYYSKHFQKRHHELPLIDGIFGQRTIPAPGPKPLNSTEADYRELLSRLDREADETLPKLCLAETAAHGTPAHGLARQVGCILRQGLFDKDFYVDLYPDVRTSGIQPILHYMQNGDFEGRFPNAIFDPHFYRSQFRGEPLNGVPALHHYAAAGEKAGLSASASFNPKRYIASNPEMGPWLDHPLTHYLHIGRSRGLATRNNVRLSAEQRVVPQTPRLPARVDVSRLKRAVNIIGPLDRLSGLGVSVRGYLKAFQELDIVPVGSRARTREFGIQAPAVGQSQFPVFLPDAAVNIVHMNGDTLPLMLEHGGHELLNNRYNVAVWYWELATLRPEWVQFVKYFHEFWASTPFIERAITSSTKLPVRLVPPYLPHLTKMGSGSRKGGEPHFVYCFDANSILERKNPGALLDAFKKAFPEDDSQGKARLTFKITYPNRSIREVERLYAARDADPRIEIIDANVSDEALHQLIASATAYVSPHRSEGLGLTVIEAMASGTPVIATPYGGVEQFVTPDAAYPVDYRLVELKDDYPPYPRGFVWADPEIASLALKLREVVDNDEDRRARAGRARANVIGTFSSEELLAKYREELERICGHIFD